MSGSEEDDCPSEQKCTYFNTSEEADSSIFKLGIKVDDLACFDGKEGQDGKTILYRPEPNLNLYEERVTTLMFGVKYTTHLIAVHHITKLPTWGTTSLASAPATAPSPTTRVAGVDKIFFLNEVLEELHSVPFGGEEIVMNIVKKVLAPIAKATERKLTDRESELLDNLNLKIHKFDFVTELLSTIIGDSKWTAPIDPSTTDVHVPPTSSTGPDTKCQDTASACAGSIDLSSASITSTSTPLTGSSSSTAGGEVKCPASLVIPQDAPQDYKVDAKSVVKISIIVKILETYLSFSTNDKLKPIVRMFIDMFKPIADLRKTDSSTAPPTEYELDIIRFMSRYATVFDLPRAQILPAAKKITDEAVAYFTSHHNKKFSVEELNALYSYLENSVICTRPIGTVTPAMSAVTAVSNAPNAAVTVESKTTPMIDLNTTTSTPAGASTVLPMDAASSASTLIDIKTAYTVQSVPQLSWVETIRIIDLIKRMIPDDQRRLLDFCAKEKGRNDLLALEGWIRYNCVNDPTGATACLLYSAASYNLFAMGTLISMYRNGYPINKELIDKYSEAIRGSLPRNPLGSSSP